MDISKWTTKQVVYTLAIFAIIVSLVASYFLIGRMSAPKTATAESIITLQTSVQQSLAAQTTAHNKSMADLTAQVEAQSKSTVDTLQKSMNQLTTSINSLTTSLEAVKTAQANDAKNITTLQSQMTTVSSKATTNDTTIATVDKKLDTSLQQLQASITTLTNSMATLSDKVTALEKSISVTSTTAGVSVTATATPTTITIPAATTSTNYYPISFNNGSSNYITSITLTLKLATATGVAFPSGITAYAMAVSYYPSNSVIPLVEPCILSTNATGAKTFTVTLPINASPNTTKNITAYIYLTNGSAYDIVINVTNTVVLSAVNY